MRWRRRVLVMIGASSPGLLSLFFQPGPVYATEIQSHGGAPQSDFSANAPAYLGEKICRSCHLKESEQWRQTAHAEAFGQQQDSALERRSCEACHGPGSEHRDGRLRPGAFVAFTHGAGAPVERQNDVCLQCHRNAARVFWFGSAHEVAQLGCSDCHDPMLQRSPSGLLRKKSVNETCFACHPRQRSEFRKRSHMPLLEGKMSCDDCHEPHGSASAGLLRADDLNQLCYRCHAEKRGPFLYEHAPVRESCANCHLPHGSNRERLLNAPLPMLCQQCHIQQSLGDHAASLLTRAGLVDGALPDERILNRGCVNCHSQVHGSNHPSGPRLHR